MVEKTGTFQVYTGNGKGKTTAAVGQAVRAVGHGWKVLMIQFMKGRLYGELAASRKMEGFIIEQHGRDEFVNPKNPAQVDRDLAEKGWKRGVEAVKSGEWDMIILDEINVAIDFGLIEADRVIELIKNRPESLELIFTGRYVPLRVMELADTVTEMIEIKHHYRKGIESREGIEY